MLYLKSTPSDLPIYKISQKKKHKYLNLRIAVPYLVIPKLEF